MLYLTWKEILYMADYDFNSIFEQINNLKKPTTQTEEVRPEKDELREVLNSVSDEIKRVMNENNFTQEDLCSITGMSQSNISKIQNSKVIPRIETLQKIAVATHTRLVISFESREEEE